jgi:hypothetical protein
MAKALLYGALIYSSTIEELDAAWEKVESFAGKFKNLKFHREYYDLAKQRIEEGQPVRIPHMTDPGLFLALSQSHSQSRTGSKTQKLTHKK